MFDPHPLSGRRILVVEDEFYIANDTERALRRAGADVVGPVAREAAALALLTRQAVDAAVVDIHLGAGPTYALADALKAADVPFVFVMGYDQGQIPERHRDVVTLLKPADPATIADMLVGLLMGPESRA